MRFRIFVSGRDCIFVVLQLGKNIAEYRRGFRVLHLAVGRRLARSGRGFGRGSARGRLGGRRRRFRKIRKDVFQVQDKVAQDIFS